MPAFITHDLFGRQLLRFVEKDVPQPSPARPSLPSPHPAATSAAGRAFLLGNQGPDPFFFALLSSQLVTLKRLGSLLHNQRILQTLEALLDYCDRAPNSERAVLRAYVAGYLCHHSLDSTAHPFVYAQQYALCAAGVAELDDRDGDVVHGLIEADLDALTLHRLRGQTIRTFRPARELPHAEAATLAALDALYCHVAERVFDLKIALGAFSRCVADMRLTLHALYSPRGIKRSLLGWLERLGRRHSLLQAMSTPVTLCTADKADNHERLPWENPFTGEHDTSDFTQLFDTALQTAAVCLQLLIKDAPADKLWNGLDFEGVPVGASG
ncbi:MAG: hypothetical protein LBP28_02295 [Coriobacteriales bacterium]|jgi:hypothetical protein|nr:hypothetical protein [Coriobacteriales bacterium]